MTEVRFHFQSRARNPRGELLDHFQRDVPIVRSVPVTERRTDLAERKRQRLEVNGRVSHDSTPVSRLRAFAETARNDRPDLRKLVDHAAIFLRQTGEDPTQWRMVR